MVRDGILISKGHSKFWSGGIITALDWDRGYMNAYNYQSSLSCTFYMGNCLVCKLYIKKIEIYMCVCSYFRILVLILEGQSFINLSIISSVQFSGSVVSDSLWPLELQRARPPCPSAAPGVYLNSCPLSRWCHPAVSSSVVPFSSRLQSFPALGSFSMSQFFASGGQSIGVSASASVFPMNIQDWFPLGWTGWISLQFKELSRVFSNTTVQKHQFFSLQFSLYSNSHIHTWPQEKP